jgi:hypothetical protein
MTFKNGFSSLNGAASAASMSIKRVNYSGYLGGTHVYALCSHAAHTAGGCGTVVSNTGDRAGDGNAG